MAQRPRAVEILRYLASRTSPPTVKDIAIGIATPEITARKWIYKLIEDNCIEQIADPKALGLVVNSPVRYYQITQFGRDCVTTASCKPRLRVNSVFALAASMGHSD